ncbi:hypothetical protein [Propionivibrio sp.]|uniref:hypothetical protein n=1 Tax=Propionivibrio sp. TaxID=2212460 RepID=UPI003BF436E8
MAVGKRPGADGGEFSPNRPLNWSSHPIADIEPGTLNFFRSQAALQRKRTAKEYDQRFFPGGAIIGQVFFEWPVYCTLLPFDYRQTKTMGNE